MRHRSVWAGLATAAVIVGTAAGCSPSEDVSVDADTVVVDVRTAGEYAEGHLDGAQNLDVQAADFPDLVAGLDPEAHYVVYCRSGSRASAAVGVMEDLGFTDVVNAGGIQDAAEATGLEVVD